MFAAVLQPGDLFHPEARARDVLNEKVSA